MIDEHSMVYDFVRPDSVPIVQAYMSTDVCGVDPVIPVDILTIVNKLKPKTSYEEDSISAKLLSKTIDKIIDPITHIVDLTF